MSVRFQLKVSLCLVTCVLSLRKTSDVIAANASFSRGDIGPGKVYQKVLKYVFDEAYDALQGKRISVINLEPSQKKWFVARPTSLMEPFADGGQLTPVDYGGVHTMRVADGDHIQVCGEGYPSTGMDMNGRPFKDYVHPIFQDCVCPDFHVKPGDIYVYKGGCKFLALNGYDWDEPGMAAQFCSAFAAEEKPRCMMRLVCAMINLHWAQMPNGGKGAYSVIPEQAECPDDWQLLDEEYVEGRGGENQCRDGEEQPLTKEECEQLPNKVDGARLSEPFVITVREDPTGCFRYRDWIFFNMHPTGSARTNRAVYCKASHVLKLNPRPGLQHRHMSCMSEDKCSQQGKCDWCGTGGLCCRHPGIWDPFFKQNGCGTKGCHFRHCCVAESEP